ncbi:MAG: hypothetical protein O6929_00880 [candidate division NC10 bacterium]|nr:hypothetical protein [candidate division NC10 bacterium]
MKQLWEAGYAGKVVRVPLMSEKARLKVWADELLGEVEELYERRGVTFVLERKGRLDFYRSFGLLRLCRRFHMEMKEVRSLRRRAYWRWFRWMRALEEPRLRIADKFAENGDGRQSYLEIRVRVRRGEPMDGSEPKEVVEMARESVRGVTWR